MSAVLVNPAVRKGECTATEYLCGRVPSLAQRKLIMRAMDCCTAIDIWCCNIPTAAVQTYHYGEVSAKMAFLAFPDLREAL